METIPKRKREVMRLSDQYQTKTHLLSELYAERINIESCICYISYKRITGEQPRSFMNVEYQEFLDKRFFVMERIEKEELKLKELSSLIDMIEDLNTNYEGVV